ncbi:hypothetical protein HPB48_015896 [Haemaphysalis longicornis]|uniref:DDE Tnp4 domain-containing protein n=1 Tax=Haemaphysalis longicornis TaxID=44386 RepID=A0A9J6FBG4_HAELO|nr:hypothetical protein HPB48_015896 [Haemaphysalis longicornis]
METTWNFSNFTGFIDGKHINIKCPPNSGTRYLNYKKTFSTVQFGVCDAYYRDALDVRKRLTAYLMTDGVVPWQDKIVTRAGGEVEFPSLGDGSQNADSKVSGTHSQEMGNKDDTMEGTASPAAKRVHVDKPSEGAGVTEAESSEPPAKATPVRRSTPRFKTSLSAAQRTPELTASQQRGRQDCAGDSGV